MQTVSGINIVGPGAKSDQLQALVQYADPNVICAVGMPVYVNLVDAGPLNTRVLTTSNSASANTGGTVVSGTNVSAGQCTGIYCPGDFTTTALASSVIPIARYGIYPVLAAAKASGTAVTVGSYLISDTTQTACLASTSVVAGKTIGQVVASGGVYQSGATIISVPGSGTTTKLVNCWIDFR